MAALELLDAKFTDSVSGDTIEKKRRKGGMKVVLWKESIGGKFEENVRETEEEREALTKFVYVLECPTLRCETPFGDERLTIGRLHAAAGRDRQRVCAEMT